MIILMGMLWIMIEEYKHLIKKFNHNEAFTFYNEFNLRRRRPSIGISLALIFGWIGIHRFWLGDKKGGITFLVFFGLCCQDFFRSLTPYAW